MSKIEIARSLSDQAWANARAHQKQIVVLNETTDSPLIELVTSIVLSELYLREAEIREAGKESSSDSS